MCSTELLFLHWMSISEMMDPSCQYGNRKSLMTGEGNVYMAPSPVGFPPGEHSKSCSWDKVTKR